MAKAQANVNGNGFCDIKSLGHSLKCTNQESIELSHEMAKDVLAMPEFIGERGIRKNHTANLMHAMESGTFEWTFVNIIFCRCNEPHNEQPKGTLFRMNGQHTCEARLQLPASMRAPIRLLRYTAATVADMRRLYSTIDRNAPRTKGHAINSYINGTEEFGSYRHHVRSKLPAGLAMWKWDRSESRKFHGAEDISYMLLKGELKLSQRVAGFLDQFSPKEYKHIMRASVVAALFETFNRSPERAIEFWSAVATGVGFSSEKDPRRKLHKFLLTNAVVGGQGNAKGKIGSGMIPSEGMYRVCIQAWNSWRRGDEVAIFRIADKRPSALA